MLLKVLFNSLTHSSMARTGSATSKLLLLRKSSVNKRAITKEEASSSCWVPHPRTGIYFPKGQEKVMNDVPVGAASFTHTFWLRNEHGVEKPDHDTPPDYYFHTNM